MFRFEIEVDLSSPIPADEVSATIQCMFRHAADRSIELRPGISGQINLGVRIYRLDGTTLIFEDRMLPETSLIEPGRWVRCRMRVPRWVVSFEENLQLVFDLVKEDEFWFTPNFDEAYRFEVRFVDAVAETRGAGVLLQFAQDGAAPDAGGELATLEEEYAPERPPERPPAPQKAPETQARYNIVFDVSDLIQYFQHARLPTGIQRVQMEVITNLVFSLPSEFGLKIGCFTRSTDFWVEIPPLFFNHICKLALADGDQDGRDWRRVLEELRAHIEQGEFLTFAPGSYLINLGTSWWLQNYFLNVRAAKARYGIRYVPFVHDCIPIMTPEHCVAGLTRDFISWVLGAFQHADHIMVNSHATASDVQRVAQHLGHPIPVPYVVELNADFRRANESLPFQRSTADETQIFLRNDLRPGEYVLFVATIESRKNHLMAFAAWLSLIKKYGLRRVPKLVCVGNRGWLNDAIYAKLDASDLLRQKVVMLSKIPDLDLERLYKNCMFTLYPSSYEGWGLPVTESLSYGKVPVLSNSSSLPEAGGELAEYFDIGSESELVQILERMIFDVGYRTAREEKIAAEFRPRSWSEIAGQILDLIRQWSSTSLPENAERAGLAERGLWPFPAQPGRYYSLTENQETHIWSGMVAGEMFRQGDGWWWPEPWGSWTKPKIARLAFLAPLGGDSSVVLFVGVRGIQGMSCVATVSVEGVATRRVPLGPEQDQWVVFRVDPTTYSRLPRFSDGVLFEVLFSADRFADFREATNGVDHRVAALGVRGFMVCAEDDVRARLRFMESIALCDMGSLSEKPVDGSEFLLGC